MTSETDTQPERTIHDVREEHQDTLQKYVQVMDDRLGLEVLGVVLLPPSSDEHEGELFVLFTDIVAQDDELQIRVNERRRVLEETYSDLNFKAAYNAMHFTNFWRENATKKFALIDRCEQGVVLFDNGLGRILEVCRDNRDPILHGMIGLEAIKEQILAHFDYDALTARYRKSAADQYKAHQAALDAFKDRLVERLGSDVLAIGLLDVEELLKEAVSDNSQKTLREQREAASLLVLLKDLPEDSKKREAEHTKRNQALRDSAMALDFPVDFQVYDISYFWQFCFDAKYVLLRGVAKGETLYEHKNGHILSAVALVENHKQAVIKKFEKYVVSYALAGSVIRGQATSRSDIDVYVVIDDTDVKKMTRGELREKLTSIIVGMGYEQAQKLQTEMRLNIQSYILTDYWENLRSGNPVIYTLLRDAVPFYDRGLAVAWKQLLSMGRIRPTQEAVDSYSTQGHDHLKHIGNTLLNLAQENLYYAVLSPSQAALMMRGIAPPTRTETVERMEKEFVQPGLLAPEMLDILKRQIEIRKEIEHKQRPTVSGVEFQGWLEDAQKYVEEMDRLIKQEKANQADRLVSSLHEDVTTHLRDIFHLMQIETPDDPNWPDLVKQHLVSTGLVSRRIVEPLKLAMDVTKQDKLASQPGQVHLLRAALEELHFRLLSQARQQHTLVIQRSDGAPVELVACHNRVFIVQRKAEGVDYERILDVQYAGSTITSVAEASWDEVQKTTALECPTPGSAVTIPQAVLDRLEELLASAPALSDSTRTEYAIDQSDTPE